MENKFDVNRFNGMRADARKRIEGEAPRMPIEPPRLNVRPNSIMLERTKGRF